MGRFEDALKSEKTSSGSRFERALQSNQKSSLSRFDRALGLGDGKKEEDELTSLISTARAAGLEVEDPRIKKPGLFSRSIDLLSRANYASAGAVKALFKEDESVFEEAFKGLRGIEKETYSDLLEEAGVQNKVLRGSLGFALDVALDPTTYIPGGVIAKGFGKAGRAVEGVARAVAPITSSKIAAKGKKVQDAFGNAFVAGYGTSPEAFDSIIVGKNKIGKAGEGITKSAQQAIKRLNRKGVTEADISQADGILRRNRATEFDMRKNQGVSRGEVDDFIKSGEVFEVPTDPKVKLAYDELLKRGDKLNKKIIKGGFAADDIYRFYSADMLSQEALARKGTKKGLGSTVNVGSQDYLKEYKGLIKEEDLLKNPFERFARTEYNIARDAMSRSITDDFIRAYGKTFNSLDEAIEAGYVPIYKKASGKVVDKPTPMMIQGADGKLMPARSGSPAGYLKPKDANLLGSQLYPEMKVLDVMAKELGFDTLTNTFKTAVTAYFPAFHVRNFISGMFQNYQTIGRKALNPENLKDGWKVLGDSNDVVIKTKEGLELTAKELNKALTDRFGGTSRYIADLGKDLDISAEGAIRLKKGLATKMNDKVRNVGNLVETQQKSVAFVAELKDQLAKGIGKNDAIKKALQTAEKAGFDYSKVTDFEAKVMRRIIPFYTFARKNAELQAKTLLNNPERILNQVKFARMLGNFFGGKTTQEDLEGLPPWARDGLGFKVKGDRFLTSLGLPLEEFLQRVNEPFKTTASSLNPLLKFPTEAKLGFDFFQQKDIRDISKISKVEYDFFNSLPKSFKDEMQLKTFETKDGETRYRANPDVLHLLRNLPTARLQSTLTRLLRDDVEAVDKISAFSSGIKIYDIDKEQQKYFDERDAKREVEDALYKAGIGGEFKKFFLFKD